MRRKGAPGFVLPIMKILKLQKVDFSVDIKVEGNFDWQISPMTFARSQTNEDAHPNDEEEEGEVVACPRLLPPPGFQDVLDAIAGLRTHVDTQFADSRSHIDTRLDGMREDIHGLYDYFHVLRPDGHP
ncbi:hypothetical protein OROMI_034643 [Orobanche minor]